MKTDYDRISKQMDAVFDQMDQVFKEVDKTFKTVEQVMDEKFRQSMSEKKYPWKKWFAWRPVKVKGHIKWMRNVYRREIPKTYVDYDDWTRYEYGTIFDVLKSESKK